jgi:hypothetical protein
MQSAPSCTTVAIDGAPRPAIVVRSAEPTTTEKAALAALSLVDLIQTQRWLDTPTPVRGWTAPPREENPLLGRRPSVLRMAGTGIALDEIVLHIRSPFVRHLSIGLEAGNVIRNAFVMKVRI